MARTSRLADSSSPTSTIPAGSRAGSSLCSSLGATPWWLRASHPKRARTPCRRPAAATRRRRALAAETARSLAAPSTPSTWWAQTIHVVGTDAVHVVGTDSGEHFYRLAVPVAQQHTFSTCGGTRRGRRGRLVEPALDEVRDESIKRLDRHHRPATDRGDVRGDECATMYACVCVFVCLLKNIALPGSAKGATFTVCDAQGGVCTVHVCPCMTL